MAPKKVVQSEAADKVVTIVNQKLDSYIEEAEDFEEIINKDIHEY